MALKIWTLMAAGWIPRITDRYGLQRWGLIGRRTGTDVGYGPMDTAGHGWTTSRGVGRRFIMAAGFTARESDGAGIRDQFMCDLIGARRWWRSSESGDFMPESGSGADLAGFRLRPSKFVIRGGDGESMAAIALRT